MQYGVLLALFKPVKVPRAERKCYQTGSQHHVKTVHDHRGIIMCYSGIWYEQVGKPSGMTICSNHSSIYDHLR